MKVPLSLSIRLKQLVWLISLATVIGLLQISFWAFQNSSKTEIPALKFINPETENIPQNLSEFNPNELDKEDWIKLGFTEKQTQTILKYKEIVGGEFRSKEQFKKCYALSEEKYNALKDYILLPEKIQYNNNTYKKRSRELSIKGRFNPDHYSQKDWEAMGFSEKQSMAILKYKDYLGGSFVSKEKFKECFIISDENYQKLSPYLILPEKTPDDFRKFKSEKPKIALQNFDPNDLSQEDWQKLGFSEKQSAVIINYKNKKLGGAFKTLEDIRNCFVISEQKFEELKPFIRLKPQKNTTESIAPAQISETDFTKVDLNKISFDQLIEFGFDKRAASSYLGFRRKLGGFADKKQILDTYNIDKVLAEKLISTCYLDDSSVKKYSLLNAPEDWLKDHPYFKYSADKIIYYRISTNDEKKIWKLLKLKPEYEQRMKLYIVPN